MEFYDFPHRSNGFIQKPIFLYPWSKPWDCIGQFWADLCWHPISDFQERTRLLITVFSCGITHLWSARETDWCRIVLSCDPPSERVEKCTVIGSHLVSALCQEVVTSGALFGILEFGIRATLLYRPLIDVAWRGCRSEQGHALKRTSYRHMGAGDHPRQMPLEVSLYLLCGIPIAPKQMEMCFAKKKV